MGKTAAKNIRLLLLDDHALFRESLARLLQAEPGFEVVADCSFGTEALRIIKSQEIDIVLLDLDLGEERGADFLESLRAERFKGKVLLVTAGVNERDVPSRVALHCHPAVTSSVCSLPSESSPCTDTPPPCESCSKRSATTLCAASSGVALYA